MNELSLQSEYQRKAFHLATLVFPIGYYFLSTDAMLWILVPLTSVVLLIDATRRSIPPLQQCISRYFSGFMRDSEKDGSRRWTGASAMFVSLLICVAAFPKDIAIAALSVMIISDAFAAIVGRTWGHAALWGKSIAGIIGFILSGYVVLGILTWVLEENAGFFAAGVLAVMMGGIVELCSNLFRIDDNITIAVTIGGVMWMLTLVLGV